MAMLMDNLDLAIEHLTRSAEQSSTIGAQGFEVESLCLLADALIKRAGSGDQLHADEILRDLPKKARNLAMAPFAEQAESLVRRLGRAPKIGLVPLSHREEQVAGLVAQGMTNREIASALVLSERTAQNHVQHILDKLGFSARSQTAAWAARRGLTPEDTQ
jgi:DNA-binding NarL/FixJ family response regulator